LRFLVLRARLKDLFFAKCWLFFLACLFPIARWVHGWIVQLGARGMRGPAGAALVGLYYLDFRWRSRQLRSYTVFLAAGK
jgi:hypothetical protein